MEEERRKHISGKSLLIPFGAALIICGGFSVAVSMRMHYGYEKVEQTNKEVLTINKLSDQFNEGSDILTDNLRLYVSTGAQKYIDAYFEEAEVTKNRHNAIEEIQKITSAKDVAEPYFNRALAYSTELMQIEYHAMKLVSMNYSTDLTKYKDVADYPLSAEEQAYTTEQRSNAAFVLVNGEEYQSYKERIHTETNTAFAKISEANEAKLLRLNKMMDAYMTSAIITATISIILLVISIFLIGQSMLYPMVKGIKSIEKDEQMDTHGLEEFSTLAYAYNKLLSRRDSLEAELRVTANTDPLTGLPNRNAINEIVKTCGEKVFKHIAVVAFDLNGLKEVNDEKGHKAGDDLLCTAADCILDFFGNDARNNCCRIGGDEFTAFLMGYDAELVENKITAFKDAQPRYSVSIACGYSYRASGTVFDMRKMYEEADEKMYKEKAAYYKSKGMAHHRILKGTSDIDS